MTWSKHDHKYLKNKGLERSCYCGFQFWYFTIMLLKINMILVIAITTICCTYGGLLSFFNMWAFKKKNKRKTKTKPKIQVQSVNPMCQYAVKVLNNTSIHIHRLSMTMLTLYSTLHALLYTWLAQICFYWYSKHDFVVQRIDPFGYALIMTSPCSGNYCCM